MKESFLKEITTQNLLDLMLRTIAEYQTLVKEMASEEMLKLKRDDLFIIHKVIVERKAEKAA